MSDKHEKARDLTESALEALDSGDQPKADKLIDQAKKIDRSAVVEVVKDLDEDAKSNAASKDQDKT